MAAGFERTIDLSDIFAAVFGVGEEMEHGTVVPEVVGACG